MKVAAVFGTRPEAIKMAPVVHALRRRAQAGADLQPLVYVTGQHRGMLDQVLRLFDIEPDADLDVMRPDQQLADLSARMLVGLEPLLERDRPDLVLVHGDTTTALAGALAAYYRRIPVGHVEAGLRTGDRYSPFPEELNRRLVDALATYHFAPTAQAVANLKAEGTTASVLQTGNTVIDALLLTLERIGEGAEKSLLRHCPALEPALARGRRLVLVTCHRRENHGPALASICGALLELTETFRDVDIVYPVHPNPQVRAAAERYLAGANRVHLLPPLDYDVFCCLMSLSHLILTDSGGVQEEAPALNKPVLVLRDTSERPEAVAAGAAKVVGTLHEDIVEAVTLLLTDRDEYRRMAEAPSPYGDGRAAERIAAFIERLAQPATLRPKKGRRDRVRL
ncbi:MAG TPA: UDP-N-acetylglucosamine 2-epimerase (non-hydrolyzing) [Gemmataceae bacterium]|nr:UDP-N-acetylglucosamine 2-epimerase (non-hydrolyzing) [Gemmataceae bacterium]